MEDIKVNKNRLQLLYCFLEFLKTIQKMKYREQHLSRINYFYLSIILNHFNQVETLTTKLITNSFN